ncbi:MAG: methyltransferase, partial [Candidatus Bathyarchaeota archaeon]|nr:methyltransferase [Candidatus Bathyarchaeota archaeon]
MKKRLKNRLSEFLSSEELTCIYNSYDVIGDIAIIRVTERSRKYSRIIAETIMNVQKNVKTVLAQTSSVRGDFRLRKLDFVAGQNKTTTVHNEYGCLFSVDVGKCYFSPRLLYERMRIAKQVGNGEVVVNMFAGVGCFSIVIAKHSKAEKVYSIDVNPVAIQFMQQNVRLNRIYRRVIPIKGDA